QEPGRPRVSDEEGGEGAAGIGAADGVGAAGAGAGAGGRGRGGVDSRSPQRNMTEDGMTGGIHVSLRFASAPPFLGTSKGGRRGSRTPRRSGRMSSFFDVYSRGNSRHGRSVSSSSICSLDNDGEERGANRGANRGGRGHNPTLARKTSRQADRALRRRATLTRGSGDRSRGGKDRGSSGSITAAGEAG
ncbi:unnamed protein product, partial [Scytosiphon promiscuus]